MLKKTMADEDIKISSLYLCVGLIDDRNHTNSLPFSRETNVSVYLSLC